MDRLTTKLAATLAALFALVVVLGIFLGLSRQQSRQARIPYFQQPSPHHQTDGRQESQGGPGGKPKAATRRTDQDGQEGKAKGWQKRNDRRDGPPKGFFSDIKITDALLVLFTFGQVAVGVMQARIVRGQRQIQERQAADAVAVQRAFVYVRGFEPLWHLDPEKGSYWWSITPIWENSGVTPTRNLLVNASYALRSDPLPADFDYPDTGDSLIPIMIGPLQSASGASGHVDGSALAEVQQKKQFLYIWGWAEYNDIFQGTPRRVTRFCYFVDVLGYPENPSEERVTRLLFRLHGAHNCADEECERQGRGPKTFLGDRPATPS